MADRGQGNEKPSPPIDEDKDSSPDESRFLVDWSSPTDTSNPKNWGKARRWCTTLIISGYAFLTPISSSMAAPGATKIGKDLHIDSEFLLSLTLSIFILGYVIGPLVLGPLSEIYGRTRVLIVTKWLLHGLSRL